MNITYEYQTNFIFVDRNKSKNKNENNQIEDVCEKLSKFHHINGIHSFSDGLLYIREEKMKNLTRG